MIRKKGKECDLRERGIKEKRLKNTQKLGEKQEKKGKIGINMVKFWWGDYIIF